MAVATLVDASARKLTLAADGFIVKIIRAFTYALNDLRDAVDVAAVETLLHDGAQDATVNYFATLELRADISDLLIDCMERAGKVAAEDLPKSTLRIQMRALKRSKGDIGMAFDRTNPEAVKWAKNRSAKLVTEINANQRAVIRSIVTRGFTEGIAPSQTARLLRLVVSLTQHQADAVVNLHQKIITSPGKKVMAGKTVVRVPEKGMDDAKLQRTLQSYSDRLLGQRAKLIARTETIAAANQGQQELWKQAIASGNLDKNVRRVWIAAPSERTCPQCMALDGQVVGMNESWGGIDNPPAHPACRCTTGLAF